MNAEKASHRGTMSSSGWGRKSPLAADSTLAATKMAPKVASNPQAIRVECLLIVASLVGSLAEFPATCLPRHRPEIATTTDIPSHQAATSCI